MSSPSDNRRTIIIKFWPESEMAWIAVLFVGVVWAAAWGITREIEAKAKVIQATAAAQPTQSTHP